MKAKKLRGLKAKIYNKQRFSEKVQLRKKLKAHEEKDTQVAVERGEEGALPAYLLDRKEKLDGKALSQQVSDPIKDCIYTVITSSFVNNN